MSRKSKYFPWAFFEAPSVPSVILLPPLACTVCNRGGGGRGQEKKLQRISHTHQCVLICTYIWLHALLKHDVCTHMHTHTHAHTCTHTHAHTHAHTWTHTQAYTSLESYQCSQRFLPLINNLSDVIINYRSMLTALHNEQT